VLPFPRSGFQSTTVLIVCIGFNLQFLFSLSELILSEELSSGSPEGFLVIARLPCFPLKELRILALSAFDCLDSRAFMTVNRARFVFSDCVEHFECL
jgi:hypothetical protein